MKGSRSRLSRCCHRRRRRGGRENPISTQFLTKNSDNDDGSQSSGRENTIFHHQPAARFAAREFDSSAADTFGAIKPRNEKLMEFSCIVRQDGGENSSRVRVCQNERAAVIDDARGLVFWFFRQVSRESPSAAAGKEINLEIATWKLANSLTSSGGVRGPVLARNKNKSSRKSSEKSPRRSKSKAAEDNNEVDLNVTHTRGAETTSSSTQRGNIINRQFLSLLTSFTASTLMEIKLDGSRRSLHKWPIIYI